MTARKFSGPLYALQVFRLDSAGYAQGQEAAWAAAESTGAMWIDGRKSAEYSVSSEVTDPIEEGNQVVGMWRWGGENIETIRVTLSDFDPDLDALIGGTAITTSTPSSYYLFSTEEQVAAARPRLGAILTQEMMGADGIDGTRSYLNRMVLNCEMQVQDGSPGFRAKAERTLIITCRKSSITPLGIAVSAFGLGVQGNKVSTLRFPSNYPVHLHSFMKNAIASTFTTTYKPTSASAVAATGSNLMTDEGAVTNPTSFATSTGLVTLAAAGTSGHRVEMLYEHQEVAA